MNVLIADDSHEITDLVRMVARDYVDLVVQVWDHFPALLTPAPWTDIDVAIVDIMLPEMSGVDVLLYLQSDHPHIKRIAFTASYMGQEDVRKHPGLVEHVLRKPCTPEDILAAIGVL